MKWIWNKNKKEKLIQKEIVEQPFEEISWELIKDFSQITSQMFYNRYVIKSKTKVKMPVHFPGCGYVGETVIPLTNRFSLIEADNDLGCYDFVILIQDTCCILIERSNNLIITDLGTNKCYRDTKLEVIGYKEDHENYPRPITKRVLADPIESIPLEIRKIIRICFDKSLFLYKEATGKVSLDNQKNAKLISNLISE